MAEPVRAHRRERLPWVASARSALTVEVHGIFVTTTRIYGHKVPIATTPDDGLRT